MTTRTSRPAAMNTARRERLLTAMGGKAVPVE
jgi:hypothetical protein